MTTVSKKAGTDWGKRESRMFRIKERTKGPHTDAWLAAHPNKKSSPKEIVGHHGHRPHGPSILWPALYEHLRAKGKTKGAAAAISNAAWKKKKVGMKTNTPTSVRGVAKSERLSEFVAAAMVVNTISKGNPTAGDVHAERALRMKKVKKKLKSKKAC